MSHDFDTRCIKRDVCEMRRCMGLDGCIHAAADAGGSAPAAAPNSAMVPCNFVKRHIEFASGINNWKFCPFCGESMARHQ
jgi:hypothetical protein